MTPRPCPICGEHPDVYRNGRGWSVRCPANGANHSVYVHGDTKAAAIELWNGCGIDPKAWKARKK